MSHLVIVDQLLLHHLHGVHLLVLLQPDQKHLGVAAAPDDPDQIKVPQAESQTLGQLDAVDAVHHRFDVLQGAEVCGYHSLMNTHG